MANDNLSPEEKDFLAKCEEELKDRYTDKDEEFMKVFNGEPSTPPIIESWWIPQNSGRRNDRRFNRRNQHYDRSGNRERNNQDRRDYHQDRRDYHQDRRDYHQDRRDYQDRRGYNDYNRGYEDRGYRNHRPRPH